MATDALTIPYDWIKNLSPELANLDSIPAMGYPPAFPWEKLAQSLAKTFEIENVTLTPRSHKWISPENIFSDMLESILLEGNIPSFDGKWAWALPSNQATALMNLLLTKKESNSSFYVNPEFQKGFFNFLGLEIIYQFNNLKYDKSLVPSLLESIQPFESACFCIDIDFSLMNQLFTSRFIISQELHRALKEHYSQRSMNITLSREIAEKVTIPIHLEIGKTQLTAEEWKQIELGDFLLLDKCTVVPEEDKMKVLMTVNGTPLLRGRVKQGNIKILEMPNYHELEDTMAKDIPENEEEDFEGDETEFESEYDENLEEESQIEEDDQEELQEEEEAEEAAEEYSEVEDEAEAAAEEAQEAPQEIEEKKESIEIVKELPLTVIVEVGRIHLPINKLLDLEPGNIIEGDIHPENGVDLVVNNKLIGKGELIRIGETLGVRILDLGHK